MALTWVKIGNLKGPKGDVGTWLHASPLTESDRFDTIGTGIRTCWSGLVAAAVGAPVEEQFDVETVLWGTAGGRQTLTTRSLNPQQFIRSQLSGGWGAWLRTFPAEQPDTGAGANRSSGFKTIPVSLTAGNGGATTLATSGAVSYPMWWTAPINRFRVCMIDKNPRFGIDRTNSVNFTNLRHGGGTIASSGNFTGSGEPFKSVWMNGQPTGDLQFSYTATNPVIGLVGGGSIGGVAQDTMPFHVWLEVEVPISTPVLSVVGDSNGCGVGTTRPVYDSWLSQYCRRIGALPIHYANSGDSLAGFLDPEHYKWNLWSDLDRPDAVFLALGSNDMAVAGMTQETLQGNSANVALTAAAKISPIQHMITIKPRNGGDSTYNGLRRTYNTWVKTKPLGVRDWHDMVTPVSSDDTVMLPGMYASDGTHMTTAGHKALADSISKIVTFFGGLRFKEAAGRVATAWDHINNREQLIYGDTGLRDVSASVPRAQWARARRIGNTVEIYINNCDLSGLASNEPLLDLPAGFRPSFVQRLDGYWSGSGYPYADSSSIKINGTNTGTQIISGKFSTTDPWPTSLPGSAFGTIPF